MQQVPEKETIDHLAELYKGFADPTRVHILYLLATRQACHLLNLDATQIQDLFYNNAVSLFQKP